MINKTDILRPFDQLKVQYEKDGFCLVDGMFTKSELQEIEDFFEDYKTHGEKIFDGKSTYQEIDPGKRQVRAMHPHRYSQRAMDWLTNPKIAKILEFLLERPALGVQTMYFYKPPGSIGHGMHQDNFYLIAAPSTCIAAWTAIDDATLDNGCLYVAPGSHRLDIQCPKDGEKEYWMGYEGSHISRFPRDYKPIPVPVKRGQTLFFHGNLIHGSGPNRTRDRHRRTFIGHYVDEATEHISKFYHPVVNMNQEVVSGIAEYAGGGPCGDDWQGGVH
ncbi:MAG: phytanoyl-CoA dioxygenase family protein [Chthoniobacterales bacterium]